MMARSKSNVREALQKVREERAALDIREALLRDEAAAELGRVLVECGAETLDPNALRRLVSRAMVVGIDTSLERLAAP